MLIINTVVTDLLLMWRRALHGRHRKQRCHARWKMIRQSLS